LFKPLNRILLINASPNFSCDRSEYVQGCFNCLIGLFLIDTAIATNIPMKDVHEVLYRIAKSAPFGLDITSSRFLNGMDTDAFQLSRIRMDSFIAAVDAEDLFDGFKLQGRDKERLEIAKQLGCGSLEAGTLVVQQYHWKFVGRPRALISYRSVVNVLLSSLSLCYRKMHLHLLKNMVEAHGIEKVFENCTYRSERESRHYYTVSKEDFDSCREKLGKLQ